MEMRQSAGSAPAKAAAGEIAGNNGGQSRNVQEIMANIRHEGQMFRIAAIGMLAGNTRAFAYLAATADYSDVREAALKQLLKDRGGLFQILEGFTGRFLQPWERELVTTLKENLDGSKDNAVLGLKLWQLQNSKFSPFGKCKGFKGDVDFVEETPVQFEEAVLARLIEETRA